MTTTINPTLISSPNSSNPFAERFHTTLPIRTKLFFFDGARLVSSRPQTLIVKCSNNSSEPRKTGSLKEVLTGMVDERVEELLNREENRALLDGLGKATERVEMAKRELALIEKQEIEAKQLREYVNQLETKTSEIAECQREISEARVMLEKAERSLGIGGVEGIAALTEEERKAVYKNEDRLESIKAASIAAIIGTLAGLPISIAQVASPTELILPSAVTFITCALFGVTFRYAIRRDLDDFHLKSGTVAAFGFVKGLGTLDGGPPLELEVGILLSHFYDGAVYVSENLLIFGFAAVALDFCIKLSLLSPFPIERSDSATTKE